MEGSKLSVDVLYDLRLLMRIFPGLVSDEMLDLAADQLPLLSCNTLPKKRTVEYQIKIRCGIQQLTCSLRVKGY